MALQSTDLLAVFRTTDLTSYKATVEDIVNKVPNPAAPSLTAIAGAVVTGEVSTDVIVIETVAGLPLAVPSLAE